MKAPTGPAAAYITIMAMTTAATITSRLTVAAQTLQSRRLIRYRRGQIEIVNRKGLKAAARECYEVVSRTFDQFLEDIHGKRHRRSGSD
jgi:hypothetical protein